MKPANDPGHRRCAPRAGHALELDLGQVVCGSCPIGRASGLGRGQFCPFITRELERGEIVCTAGEPADHVWLVKRGVVGLGLSRDEPDRLDTLRLPGTFVGLECLLEDRYRATGRTVARTSLCGATREGFRRWARESDERLALIVRAALRDSILTSIHLGDAP